MGFDLNGRVGPLYANDGSEESLRLAKDLSLVTADGHIRFFELASRGLFFSASGPVAGVAHGTAFGTTPPLYIHNPQGSGVAVVMAYVTWGYVSGTLGAGFYAFGQSAQATAPTGGTEIVTQVGLTNGVASRGRGAAKAYQGSTIAATPTILRPSGFSFGAFAGAAGPLNPVVRENIDGEFIILPGSGLAVQGIATAGTTPLLVHAAGWYEVPLMMATP